MKRRSVTRAKEPKPPKAERLKMVDGIPVPIPPAGRDWLTVAEIAEALDVNRAQVYDWRANGVVVGEIGTRRRVRLQCIGIGRKLRIYPEAMLTFLRETSLPPALASAPAPEGMIGDEEQRERIESAWRELRAMGVES